MTAEGGADLILVQHALAHVDDLDGLAAGLARHLAPDGAIAIEFHDLASLIAGCQFDILGHGHRSYLSLTSLECLLARHRLSRGAARRTPIHGGSIQALATRAAPGVRRRPGVHRLLARDAAGYLTAPATYVRFGQRAMIASQRGSGVISRRPLPLAPWWSAMARRRVQSDCSPLQMLGQRFCRSRQTGIPRSGGSACPDQRSRSGTSTRSTSSVQARSLSSPGRGRARLAGSWHMLARGAGNSLSRCPGFGRSWASSRSRMTRPPQPVSRGWN